jgi:hypothetical protein
MNYMVTGTIISNSFCNMNRHANKHPNMNVLHDYRHETIYVTTTVQIELEKNNTRIKTKVQSAFVIKDMLLVLR